MTEEDEEEVEEEEVEETAEQPEGGVLDIQQPTVSYEGEGIRLIQQTTQFDEVLQSIEIEIVRAYETGKIDADTAEKLKRHARAFIDPECVYGNIPGMVWLNLLLDNKKIVDTFILLELPAGIDPIVFRILQLISHKGDVKLPRALNAKERAFWQTQRLESTQESVRPVVPEERGARGIFNRRKR
jgi:hypothetical protein